MMQTRRGSWRLYHHRVSSHSTWVVQTGSRTRCSESHQAKPRLRPPSAPTPRRRSSSRARRANGFGVPLAIVTTERTRVPARVRRPTTPRPPRAKTRHTPRVAPTPRPRRSHTRATWCGRPGGVGNRRSTALDLTKSAQVDDIKILAAVSTVGRDGHFTTPRGTSAPLNSQYFPPPLSAAPLW